MNWWLVNKYPTKASFRKEEFVVRIEIFIMVKVHIVAQWVLTFVFGGLKLTQYRCDFQRFTYLGTGTAHVVRNVSKEISAFDFRADLLILLYPDDEGTIMLSYVEKHSPDTTVPVPKYVNL